MQLTHRELTSLLLDMRLNGWLLHVCTFVFIFNEAMVGTGVGNLSKCWANVCKVTSINIMQC